tara:strand:+ start:56 stop:1126 length:1071 start_codon:yes stop_codon:yes gene_type:complete
MKKLLLLSMLFVNYVLIAQSIVVDGLTLPHQIAKHKNYLYVNNVWGFETTDTHIARVNITTGEKESMFNTGRALALAVKDNYLYIAGDKTNLLYRVDLNAETLILETIFDFDDAEPNRILSVNNDLYVSADNEDGKGYIFKFSLDDISNPIVRENDFPVGALTELNGYLYFGEYITKEIKRIGISAMHVGFDISSSETYINTFINITGLTSFENKLYFSSTSNSNIFMINTLSDNLESVVYKNTDANISSLSVINQKLYFSQQRTGKVSTFNLVETLSINNNIKNNLVTIYPNPSTNYIKVSGLTESVDYKLYNALGKEKLSGTISNNDTINVQDFAKGFYILRFSSGETKRIIKN